MSHLMNPHTGSVDTKENWLAEGYTPENSDLIEVIKVSGQWVELDVLHVCDGCDAEFADFGYEPVVFDCDGCGESSVFCPNCDQGCYRSCE